MYCNSYLVVVLVAVAIVRGNDDFKTIDSIQQEKPCLAQGGVCTIATDCPKGHLVEEKGLCPDQQMLGVECCYGLSIKETRCEKRGGSCLPKDDACHDFVTFKKATDCPNDTTCCILLK